MKRILALLQWLDSTRHSFGQKTWFIGKRRDRGPRFMLEVELFWEARDLWSGLFWKHWPAAFEFYLCIVPGLPLRIYVLSYEL